MSETTAPAPPPTQRKAGCLTRLAVAGGIGVSAMALGLFVGWAWLRSEAGERFLVRQIEAAVGNSMEQGSLTIGDLDTDLWGNIGISDAALLDGEGARVVSVPRADVQVSLLPLLWDQRLQVRRATLFRPDVDLRTTSDGLNITQLFASADPNATRSADLLPIDLTIEQLQVRHGEVTLDGTGITELSLDTRLVYANDVLTVQPIDLTGDWVGEVASGPLVASGGVSLDWDDDRLDLTQLRVQTLDSEIVGTGAIRALSTTTDLDIDVKVATVDMARLDPLLLGNGGFIGRWTGDVHVGGTPQVLDIVAVLDDVKGTAGGLDAAVTVDLGADELAWAVKGDLHDFELNGLLSSITGVLRLNGEVDVTGHGTTWPDGMVIEGHVNGGEQVIYDSFFIDRLVGDFRIENGVVNLIDVQLANPYLDVVGNGTIDVIDGPLDLRIRGPIKPAGLASTGLPGLAGRGRADVRITGDIFADTVDYALRGTAQVDDFDYQGLVQMQRLNADLSGRVRDDRVVLDLDLAAQQTTSNGVVIDTLTADNTAVTYRYDGNIRASSNTLHATTLRYPDVFTIADGSGGFDFTMPPSGDYIADVDVTLGAHDLLGYTGNAGVAEAQVTPQSADFDVWFQDGFRTLARTIGSYDLQTARVDLVGLEAAPIPGGAWRANGPVQFTVAEGGVADARVDIVSRYGRVTALGDLATTGELDGRVGIHNLEMNYVRDLMGLEQQLAGEVDVHLDLQGPASAAEIDGYVRGDIALDDRTPLSVDMTINAHNGIASIDSILLAGSEPLAAIEGDIPVILDLASPALDTDGNVWVHGLIEPGPLGRFRDVFGSDVPQGRVSAEFNASGALLDPALTLRGVAESPIPNLANDGRVELYVDRNLGDLTVWGMALEGFGPVAAIDGTATTQLSEVFAWALGEGADEPDWTDYDRFVDALDVNLRTDDLPVAVIADAAQLDADVGGYLRGTAHIEGSASQPIADMDLHWLDASMGVLEVEDAYIDLDHDETGYRLDSQLVWADDGRLAVRGDLPVDIDLRTELDDWVAGNLDLQVTGTRIPVQAVTAWIPDASQGRGTIEMGGTVGGTLLQPDPRVQISLANGGLAYGPTGVLYENANGIVNISRQQITLDAFSVETNARRGIIALASELTDSRIDATATAIIDGWYPTEVAGDVSMRNAWLVALPDSQIQSSGNLTVSGDYPNLLVRGDVEVEDALIIQDLASFLTVGPLELDERIRVVRTDRDASEGVAQVEEPEPGLTETIDVQIGVNMGRKTEVQVAFPFLDDLGAIGASITRADVQARLGGDLDFQMQGGQMALYGPVEVIDGTMRVLQTSFTIEEGTTTFQGDMYNPYLDLNATSTIGTAVIDMVVSGTAEQPDVAFDSPQYPDPSQVLAMLITGRELDTLSSDQGNAATEALLGLLVSSLFSGVRAGTISYDPDGTFRVGIPVFSSVNLEVAVAPQPGIGDNQVEVQGEWAIAPKLVFESTIGTQFNYADLFWETRF